MKRIALVGMVFLLALGSIASATLPVVAFWDFGPNSTNYTLAPQDGSGVMTAGGADYDADGGNGVAFLGYAAGQAIHWTDVSKSGGDDAYIIIAIDTTGWQDMSIRWDYMSDSSGGKQGPVRFDLDYAVGSGDWINILNNEAITRDGTWHEFSYDLSSLTAINNQSSVQFRINDIKEDDIKDGDYWQDNIQLTGVSVPEPLSIAFLALGGLALLKKRQK
jgi:hypothetical protein